MVIKPDAVQEGKVGEILEMIHAHGMEVLAQKEYQFSREEAEEFYQQHKGQVLSHQRAV